MSEHDRPLPAWMETLPTFDYYPVSGIEPVVIKGTGEWIKLADLVAACPPPSEGGTHEVSEVSHNVQEGHRALRGGGLLVSEVQEARQTLPNRLASPPQSAAPGWQDIDDVQPEHGQYCLVWKKWPGRVRVYMFQRRQINWTWEGLYGWEPTYWMPLPAPPGETP